MSAGYRFCRKCRYDFISDGPHDRICEDCLIDPPTPRPRVRLNTIPTPVMVDLSPEAYAARWSTMEHIVKGVRFTSH